MPSAKKPNKVMRGSTRGGKKVRVREEGARRVAVRDEVPIHVSDAESDGEAAPAHVVKQVARGRKKRPTKNSSEHKDRPRAAETTATSLVESKQVQEMDVGRVGNQPAHKDESQTAATVDIGSMQSQELTSFLMSISRPDLVDYTRMKKTPHVRALHLKPGVGFNVTQSRHLIGTIAYVTGTEVKKSCNRCAGDYGPFPKCITVEGELNGACAACFYAGKEKRCIFPPELEPDSPPPISAEKEIADAVQARYDINSQAFLAMKDEPRIRDLDVRHTFDSLAVYCERGATAAMAYLKGEEQHVQCTRCADMKGPFQKCVVFDGELDGVCASCYYAHKGRQCIFPVTSASLVFISKATSTAPPHDSGPVSTKPVARKRKADVNDDGLSPIALLATKRRHVQEVDTAWTQAIQKMEKYMRKLEKVKRRLGKIKATAEVQGPKPERLIHRFEKYTAKLEIVHAELKGLVGMNASAN